MFKLSLFHPKVIQKVNEFYICLCYQFVSNWPKSLFSGDAFNVQGDKVPDVFLQRNVESLLFNLRESAKVADDFVRPASQVAAQTDVVDGVHGQVLNEQDPFALWVADVLPVIVLSALYVNSMKKWNYNLIDYIPQNILFAMI